jgi:hypothetical protein
VCQDEEQNLFAVLVADDKYYRLNFSIVEDGSVVFEEDITELEDYIPEEEPQFSAEAIAEYVKSKQTDSDDEPEKDDEEEKCPNCGKPIAECECEKEDDDENKEKGKKEKYNLEDIQEYVELSNNYSALEANYATAQSRISDLESQVAELTTFKKGIEKAEKEKMIASFYMLSDEDKKDVIENIDNYSLNDIEAKLSILCVRKKVNFNLDENDKGENNPTVFHLDSGMSDEAPAWVKALRSVANEM